MMNTEWRSKPWYLKLVYLVYAACAGILFWFASKVNAEGLDKESDEG